MQATITLSEDDVLEIVTDTLKARGLEVTACSFGPNCCINLNINVVSTAPAKRTRKSKAVELPNFKDAK